MHTLARSPVREASLKRQAGNRAVTLIELLTVIAIIAILAAITFGVVKGVNERAAIGQAKAELSAIAASLESYKRQYGDYPWIGSAANSATATSPSDVDAQGILFNALCGKRGPGATNVKIDAKPLLDLSKFSLQGTATANMPAAGANQAANAFQDPWGRRYLYYYKTGTSAQWLNTGYVLLSVGPDGLAGITVSTAGLITNSNAVQAADNIYANK
jgi:prepilin-type N-terminal cleavage/methylation domain-containing protein